MSATTARTRVTGMANTGAVVLAITDCASCGVIFAVPVDYEDRRREDGGTFYCPNGHTLSYKETANDRLKRDLERANRRLEYQKARSTHLADQLETSERRRAAAKGQLTKAKNRIARGVCPCCNRHFADLARHMAGQHPDYAPPRADQ